MVEQENSEGHIPSLQDLVHQAEQKFKEKNTFINQFGKEEAYAYFNATADVVYGSDLSRVELLVSLIRQTDLIPAEFDLALAESANTWDELFSELSIIILDNEIRSSRPDIVSESARRDAQFEI